MPTWPLRASGKRKDRHSSAASTKHRQLTANRITRTDVLRMIKRRAQEAGLPSFTRKVKILDLYEI
jgi:hypothetical protein